MKILVYSVCLWPSHFETDLEIAQRYIDRGHEVVFLRCSGQLPVCTTNIDCPNVKCLSCRSRFDNGISMLSPSVNDIKTLKRPNEVPSWPKFSSIQELMEFEIDGIALGRGVASSLISRLGREHKLDTTKEFKNVCLELDAAFIVMQNSLVVLESTRPDRVVLFNGRFSTLHPMVEVCKKMGVDYEVHERGATHRQFITRLNESIHSIEAAEREIYELWGDGGGEKEAAAYDWFLNRRKGKTQQWFSFVKDQEPTKLPACFDLGKRNILICNSTIEEYCAISGWERTPIGDDNEVIEKILLNFESRKDFVFYLRCHPNLKNTDNTQVRELNDLARRYKNIVFILPESDVSSYALLDNCEKVITFGSTMGAEAVIYGKPSIVVGPALFQGLGATYNVDRSDVLINLIERSDLPAKPQLGALQYGYWESKRGQFFKYYDADDLATGRFKGKQLKAALTLRILGRLNRLLFG